VVAVEERRLVEEKHIGEGCDCGTESGRVLDRERREEYKRGP